MLTLLVIVLCPLLPSFTVSSPGVTAPTDASAVQRLYGEAAAAADSSDLHRYLGVVEKACLSEARSTAACLSCETLSAAVTGAGHGVNAFVCCKWEAVYAQCLPIVEGLGRVDHRLPVPSERSGYLGKRYRNRFLGKRSDLENVFQNDDDDDYLDGYKDLEKDVRLYLLKRGKATGAGGRRPNNFLGKRRNTFLGKRYGNVLRQVSSWDLEDNGRGKGNLEEIPGHEAWKK